MKANDLARRVPLVGDLGEGSTTAKLEGLLSLVPCHLPIRSCRGEPCVFGERIKDVTVVREL